MRLSIDTGGTFTDLVVEDDDGSLSVHKRPTTPDDPPRGILDVLDVAAAARGIERAELLAGAHTLVHATTHSLNALITGRTARVGLLASAGHLDMLVLREGGREHFNARGPYPEPFVPRALTFGVGGRILQSGAESVALDEESVARALRRLDAAGVEGIAVCLLWSIVNPRHERRVGELIERQLPGIAYTLSHQLSPSLREFRRASATAIDVALKPLMAKYLESLAARLTEAGFGGRLLMVTSAGMLLDVEDVARAPIHSIKSGPAMAPVAAREFSRELGRSAAVVADTGGTSYDVSAVRDGVIPWSRETWLGRPYHSHLVGFPSVDVRSYGAGGGSIAWVDSGGLLHVGPQSAGAVPGPAAYGKGGTHPTFTDAAVVLGHLDPANFLGGAMPLDDEAAGAAMEAGVGRPLGLGRHAAAIAVVELITEHMARAIEDTVLRQGIDPADALLVAGGGAAGLNAVAVAARVGCRQVLVPAVSAALSAAGALVSQIGKDFVVSRPMRASAIEPAEMRKVLLDLRRRAERYLDDVSDSVFERGIDLFAEGHYRREVWDIEVPIQEADGLLDAEALLEAFHGRHEELYAVQDLSADVEIVAWRARAWARPARAPAAPDDPFVAAPSASRSRVGIAHFPGFGAAETSYLALTDVPGSAALPGPAVISSDVMTTVIPPGAAAVRFPSSALLIDVDSSADRTADERTSTGRSSRGES